MKVCHNFRAVTVKLICFVMWTSVAIKNCDVVLGCCKIYCVL